MEKRVCVWDACEEGDLDALQQWFPYGPNDQRINSRGDTVLHLVVKSAYVHVFDWLVSYSLNLNAQDDYGTTPLMQACSDNQEPMIRRLLAHGASVSEQDCMERTALHWACITGRLDEVTLLLEHGADPDVRDRWGRVPEDLLPSDSGIRALLQSAHEHGCGLK
jgi:uncharacterized protein